MPFQPTMMFAAGYATATTAMLQGVQMAVVDLSLTMTSSLESSSIGKPITARVHIDFSGQPVAGAFDSDQSLDPTFRQKTSNTSRTEN